MGDNNGRYDREKMARIHEAVDKLNVNMVKAMEEAGYSEAAILMAERVQLAFMHTLVDLRTVQHTELLVIEAAVAKLVANIMSLFIRSAIPADERVAAVYVSARMHTAIARALHEELCSHFGTAEEGPTESDSIH